MSFVWFILVGLVAGWLAGGQHTAIDLPDPPRCAA